MRRGGISLEQLSKRAKIDLASALRILKASAIGYRTTDKGIFLMPASAEKLLPKLSKQARINRAGTGRARLKAGKLYDNIYFIRCNEFVKIGFTYDIDARLETLQRSSPYKLELLLAVPGSAYDEQILHTRFREFRERGEWFRLTESIQTFIGAQKAERDAKSRKSPADDEQTAVLRAALNATFPIKTGT